jgi:hypothetical protein
MRDKANWAKDGNERDKAFDEWKKGMRNKAFLRLLSIQFIFCILLYGVGNNMLDHLA